MTKTDLPTAPPAWGALRTIALVFAVFAAGVLVVHTLDERRREAAQDAIVLTLLRDACPDPTSSVFVRALNTSAWTAIDVEFVLEAHQPGRDDNLAPHQVYAMHDALGPGQSAGRCWPYPRLADTPAAGDAGTGVTWDVVRTSVTFLH